MQMIHNPIIPGMAPDPSIIRVGEDYYIATSTFHWTPAIQIFHSQNLVSWELAGYALAKGEVELRGTNTPAGIWAPHLSYDEEEKKFYLAFSHMQNMAGREFNAENYVMWTENIQGPWSKPVYMTSIGFDPALYHEGGKHYISVLEWETRVGYQKPGHLVLAEADLANGGIKGKWHRLTTGFTSRGCVEAPQIYKHDKWYYLLAASGGTGYAHGIEIGRSTDIFGPYEPHPSGEPIITSSPRHLFSLGDPDAGHFEMYNPRSIMQKAGHGSLVETQNHEWYIAHLMSRPLPHTKLNPLGRETALQKVVWTNDGWLQLADGSNLAKMDVPAPSHVQGAEAGRYDVYDDFATGTYSKKLMTPYHWQDASWAQVKDGHLEIKGANSLFSQHKPSILASRATAFRYTVQAKLAFEPDHYSETAGIGLYYDSNNWLYAHIALDDREERKVLSLMQAKLGERIVFEFDTVPLTDMPVELKIEYDYGTANVFYRVNDAAWTAWIEKIDVSYLSDEGVNGEPGEIGGFTGLFNFMGSVDAHQHDSHAEFYYYKVENQD